MDDEGRLLRGVITQARKEEDVTARAIWVCMLARRAVTDQRSRDNAQRNGLKNQDLPSGDFPCNGYAITAFPFVKGKWAGLHIVPLNLLVFFWCDSLVAFSCDCFRALRFG